MSDLYLDKSSTLGLYLMNESNNVDLESVDPLMRPIVALLTAKTSIISRFSCDGHLQEVDDSTELFEGSYLMLTGDANDLEFTQHWVNRIQTKLRDELVIRCKLEYHKSMIFNMDGQPVWYPSFTIRSREHYDVQEVEEYHQAMLETLEELINDPMIGKLVNKFPTVGKHNEAWFREQLQVHSSSNRDFFNTWIAPEPEVAIIEVIDKGAKQSSVSKYPTDEHGRPLNAKGRPLY